MFKIKKLFLSLLAVFLIFTAPLAAFANAEYIGNKRTHKFHYDYCYWVSKMNEENKLYDKTRKWLIENGYIACKVCKP